MMKLVAYVPRSTFDKMLRSLRPSELSSVSQAVTGPDGSGQVCVQADTSEDRMLEFALEADATVANPRNDNLPCFDRLIIECHTELKDYLFESYNGQLVIWKQSEEEVV